MIRLDMSPSLDADWQLQDSSSLAAWLGAHAVGAALLLWIAMVNGYPLLFADSGGYLRVGTELRYLFDRPVTYGLFIAPLARLFGLWGVVAVQSAVASWLVGEVLIAVTKRRSAVTLVIVLGALAGASSLPWFVGQVMPDLFTSLMALTLFLLVFVPGSRWRTGAMVILLAGQIALHLSHFPIAGGLIVVCSITLLWQGGWQSSMRGVAPALAALVVALTAVCTANLAVAGRFQLSLEPNQFLAARAFDARIGQPVLDRICRTERWLLCETQTFVSDPHRSLPGQDYLWALDSPRGVLRARNVEALRSEEGNLTRRVIIEDPSGTLKTALTGWGSQLVRGRAADGMIAYPAHTQVIQQVYRHFPAEREAYDSSLQHDNVLQQLAVVPDRVLCLLIALFAPFVLRSAVKQGDHVHAALVVVTLATIVGNAAVCGILSGPFDRYQSRVLWLLVLLGSVSLAKVTGSRFQVARHS